VRPKADMILLSYCCLLRVQMLALPVYLSCLDHAQLTRCGCVLSHLWGSH